MLEKLSAIGVDLGGTKIELAVVDTTGVVQNQIRIPTNVKEGAYAVEKQIIEAIKNLRSQTGTKVVGVGIGVAGQIDAVSGVVHFAPNLQWHEVPIQEDLSQALQLPVTVVNDVRAITWGEWIYGAGQGCQDLIALFVGTGIGGGLISGGRMLSGYTNTSGELGHTVIDLHGPLCTCGNWGCLEAIAGGWAIAKKAIEAVQLDEKGGNRLLRLANGDVNAITAKLVQKSALEKDPLAMHIMEEAKQALIAGSISFVNAFNPQRLILGGGVIEGMPDVISRVDEGVRKRALKAATRGLEVVPAKLGYDAGVRGAAALVLYSHINKKREREEVRS